MGNREKVGSFSTVGAVDGVTGKFTAAVDDVDKTKYKYVEQSDVKAVYGGDAGLLFHNNPGLYDMSGNVWVWLAAATILAVLPGLSFLTGCKGGFSS